MDLRAVKENKMFVVVDYVTQESFKADFQRVVKRKESSGFLKVGFTVNT